MRAGVGFRLGLEQASRIWTIRNQGGNDEADFKGSDS